jgi:hypothetical protein
MEDGIERMMTSELYNIHYIDEKKKKIKELTNVKELKEPITVTKNQNELNLKDIKESRPTNPQ